MYIDRINIWADMRRRIIKISDDETVVKKRMNDVLAAFLSSMLNISGYENNVELISSVCRAMMELSTKVSMPYEDAIYFSLAILLYSVFPIRCFDLETISHFLHSKFGLDERKLIGALRSISKWGIIGGKGTSGEGFRIARQIFDSSLRLIFDLPTLPKSFRGRIRDIKNYATYLAALEPRLSFQFFNLVGSGIRSSDVQEIKNQVVNVIEHNIRYISDMSVILLGSYSNRLERKITTILMRELLELLPEMGLRIDYSKLLNYRSIVRHLYWIDYVSSVPVYEHVFSQKIPSNIRLILDKLRMSNTIIYFGPYALATAIKYNLLRQGGLAGASLAIVRSCPVYMFAFTRFSKSLLYDFSNDIEKISRAACQTISYLSRAICKGRKVVIEMGNSWVELDPINLPHLPVDNIRANVCDLGNPYRTKLNIYPPGEVKIVGLHTLVSSSNIAIKGCIYLSDVLIPGMYSIPYNLLFDDRDHHIEFEFKGCERRISIHGSIPRAIKRYFKSFEIREIHMGLNPLRRGKKISLEAIWKNILDYGRVKDCMHMLLGSKYYDLYNYAFHIFSYPIKISFDT